MNDKEMKTPNKVEIPIKIDRKPYKVESETLRGAEIKSLANIGNEYDLWQEVPGEQDDLRIDDSTVVNLKPGMHFYTIKKIVNPGADSAPGVLLSDDAEYLASKNLTYTVQTDLRYHYLILKDYKLPAHYNIDKTNILIKIPRNGYPMVAIDMFYVHPHVKYKNGNTPVAADVTENMCDVNWQRFSRHYDWRPGIDSLASHLAVVYNELKKQI